MKHPSSTTILARHAASLFALIEWGVEAAPGEQGRPFFVGSHALARAGLRGVSSKQLDILLPAEPRWDDIHLIEIGRRAGAYDDATRWRLTARPVGRGGVPAPFTPANLVVNRGDIGFVTVTLGDIETSPLKLWNTEVTPEGSDRIVGWHWSRYFHFLPGEARDEVAALLRAALAGCSLTINEANRFVSRELYRCARERGWRKLTARERRDLGFRDDRQWRSKAELDLAYQGHPSGVSEHTLVAARGLAREIEDYI